MRNIVIIKRLMAICLLMLSVLTCFAQMSPKDSVKASKLFNKSLKIYNKDRTKAVKYMIKAAELGNNTSMLSLIYENSFSDKERAYWSKRYANKTNSPLYIKYVAECHYSGIEGFELNKDSAYYYMLKQAERGDKYAQYKYGIWLYRDEQKEAAHKWILCAANSDYADAQTTIGLMYQEGEGVGVNLEKGHQWIEKGALNGDSAAYYYLGQNLYYGTGCEKNRQEAFKWLSKYTENVNAKNRGEASLLLGLMYESGDGCSKDLNKALKLLIYSANCGVIKAQKIVGSCYYLGKGVDMDREEALKWYMKAAKQGDAGTQCITGELLFAGVGSVYPKYTEAVEWFKKSAKQGYAAAYTKLGECFLSGKGVTEDKEQAVAYFKKASDNDPVALYKLGICYCSGQGVEQNYEEAVKCFKNAAERGVSEAQYNLAVCYYNGEGVERDYKKAFDLYFVVAESGNADAQANLAEMFEKGKGTKRDLDKALFWYNKAANQGNFKAKLAINRFND